MVPLIAAFLGATACIIAGLIALNAASGGASTIRMASLSMEPRSFGIAFLFLGFAAAYVCYRVALTAIFRFQGDRQPPDTQPPDTKG